MAIVGTIKFSGCSYHCLCLPWDTRILVFRTRLCKSYTQAPAFTTHGWWMQRTSTGVAWWHPVTWDSSTLWYSALTASALALIRIRPFGGIVSLVSHTLVQELFSAGPYNFFRLFIWRPIKFLCPWCMHIWHSGLQSIDAVLSRSRSLDLNPAMMLHVNISPLLWESPSDGELDWRRTSCGGGLLPNGNRLECHQFTRGGDLLSTFITCPFSGVLLRWLPRWFAGSALIVSLSWGHFRFRPSG